MKNAYIPFQLGNICNVLSLDIDLSVCVYGCLFTSPSQLFCDFFFFLPGDRSGVWTQLIWLQNSQCSDTQASNKSTPPSSSPSYIWNIPDFEPVFKSNSNKTKTKSIRITLLQLQCIAISSEDESLKRACNYKDRETKREREREREYKKIHQQTEPNRIKTRSS